MLANVKVIIIRAELEQLTGIFSIIKNTPGPNHSLSTTSHAFSPMSVTIRDKIMLNMKSTSKMAVLWKIRYNPQVTSSSGWVWNVNIGNFLPLPCLAAVNNVTTNVMTSHHFFSVMTCYWERTQHRGSYFQKQFSVSKIILYVALIFLGKRGNPDCMGMGAAALLNTE